MEDEEDVFIGQPHPIKGAFGGVANKAAYVPHILSTGLHRVSLNLCISKCLFVFPPDLCLAVSLSVYQNVCFAIFAPV